MDNNSIHLEQSNGADKWQPSSHYYQPQRYPAKPGSPVTPRLLSLSPSQGLPGTMMTMVLQDLPLRPVKLAFNSLVVDTKQLPSQNGTMTTLLATVPSFDSTLSATPSVPISVCFLGNNGIIDDTFFVTNFTFNTESNQNQDHQQMQQQQCQYERKRSYASLTEDNFCASPHKRSTYEDMQCPPSYDPNVPFSSYDQIGLPSPYAPYIQQRVGDQNSMAPAAPQPQPQHHQHHPSLSMIMESPAHAQQQQQPVYSPLPSKAAPLSPSLPTERRKSYQQQRPSAHTLKSTPHQPSTSVANYQPYPGLVSRNNFEIVDDLDTMMHNWSPMEQQQGRRLVRFWREDSSSANDPSQDDFIRCGCQPVSQTDSAALDTNNTVVSCIYWPEHDEYFITSVDCIYLLESLMKTHFGVEEKNRIRRNLEGFRPLTVAKSKPVSAEFFKRVMGFPHPKPRNIEKDIKAFHWKLLPFALKKIITKYSAATSSDASPTGLYSSPLATLSAQRHQQGITANPVRQHPSSSTSTSSSASSSSLSLSSSSSTSSLATNPPFAEEEYHLSHPQYHPLNQRPNKQQQHYYNNQVQMSYSGYPHQRQYHQDQQSIVDSTLPSSSPTPPTSSSPSPSLQYHNKSNSASPVMAPPSSYASHQYQSIQPAYTSPSLAYPIHAGFAPQVFADNGYSAYHGPSA